MAYLATMAPQAGEAMAPSVDSILDCLGYTSPGPGQLASPRPLTAGSQIGQRPTRLAASTLLLRGDDSVVEAAPVLSRKAEIALRGEEIRLEHKARVIAATAAKADKFKAIKAMEAAGAPGQSETHGISIT